MVDRPEFLKGGTAATITTMEEARAMIDRRGFLLGSAGLSAVLATAGLPRVSQAQSRPFTFVSWGGALSKMEETAFLEPFFKEKGISYVSTSPMETAKIKTMVEAGKVEWDLTDVDGASVWRGGEQGFLETLDMSRIPNAAALKPGWVTPYGIATSAGGSIIAWSKEAFPDGGPSQWADFWDVERFPGKRGMYKGFYWNYEVAMLAEGATREEIYPVTDEKADMAFRKLEELKPHVAAWWSSGPQPAQLLTTGEATLSSAWSGRVLAALSEGAPIDYTYNQAIAWANWWSIPKGTPYLDVAYEALNYALGEEPQAKLLELNVYGPVLEAAAAKADDATQKTLVMAPRYADSIHILNEQEGARYGVAYEERWNQFLLS